MRRRKKFFLGVVGTVVVIFAIFLVGTSSDELAGIRGLNPQIDSFKPSHGSNIRIVTFAQKSFAPDVGGVSYSFRQSVQEVLELLPGSKPTPDSFRNGDRFFVIDLPSGRAAELWDFSGEVEGFRCNLIVYDSVPWYQAFWNTLKWRLGGKS